MNDNQVTINVIIDENIYSQFYKFEKFSRNRGLMKLVIFAVFLCTIGIISLVMDQILLGIVNLGIGLGLPIMNVRKFYKTIQMQIKVFELEVPKAVYSLQFSEEPNGIEVTNHGGGDEALIYEWDAIHGVYRVEGCIYFYVLPNKAFLLPDGQASVDADSLWSLFTEILPTEKIHDRR